MQTHAFIVHSSIRQDKSVNVCQFLSFFPFVRLFGFNMTKVSIFFSVKTQFLHDESRLNQIKSMIYALSTYLVCSERIGSNKPSLFVVIYLQMKDKGEKRIKMVLKHISYFESCRYCVGNQSFIIRLYLIVCNRKLTYSEYKITVVP